MVLVKRTTRLGPVSFQVEGCWSLYMIQGLSAKSSFLLTQALYSIATSYDKGDCKTKKYVQQKDILFEEPRVERLKTSCEAFEGR